jgi:hypothetical protein
LQRAVRNSARVQPDAQDIDDGLDAHPHPDAAVLAAMADDPDLADLKAGEPREIQQLHVEREAVDRQVGRQRRDGLGAQQLVSALRVVNPAHGNEAHQRVEDPPADAAAPGLAGSLRAGRFARSDDDQGGGGR